MNFKSPKMLFWFFIGLALVIPSVVSTLSLLLNGRPTQFALLLALAIAIIGFSSIPLFVLGLKGFKHELRRACGLLCIGIGFYGIGQLQYPLLTVFPAPFWQNSGLAALPFFFAIILLYLGMRRFGKLMDLKLVWMSFIWVPLAAIASGVLVAVLTKNDRSVFMMLETLLSVILLSAIMVAVHIRRIVVARYSTFLTYLAASFGMLIIAAMHDIALELWVPDDNWYADNFGAMPALFVALLFLLAGYAFCRINLDTENEQKIKAASPIDVITYLAGLATNVQEVDVQLDELRRITAQMTPGELSPSQEADLAVLYKKLETYLIEKEPLRSFSREGIRERIRIHFQFDPHSTSPFWKILSEKVK